MPDESRETVDAPVSAEPELSESVPAEQAGDGEGGGVPEVVVPSAEESSQAKEEAESVVESTEAVEPVVGEVADVADEDDDESYVDPAYADSRDDVEPLEYEEEEEDVPADDLEHKWYILKVQVNRETSICDALRRRVKINGLEPYFKEILVPTEDVAEFNKSGKRRIVKKKLYPGYIMVNMVINDETWFLVRETSGIGDFTGSAGKPTPMDPVDVDRILNTADPDDDEEPIIKTTIPFNPGDRVRIKEGGFENFEGDVETIHEANGQVTVIINIFGRPNPVDLAHWQIEKI